MKRHVAEAFCHQVITTQFMAGGFPVEGFAAKVLEQRRSRHGDFGWRRLSPSISSRVLLCLRNNEPARNWYFVPGGMILKNKRLADAFSRLLKTETNYAPASTMRGSSAHSSIFTRTTVSVRPTTTRITWCSASNSR